jgi:predicted HicB family RNase H-like nuclease|nr:MAG TPA: hypothetical protein [Caudoviricetes sp.]
MKKIDYSQNGERGNGYGSDRRCAAEREQTTVRLPSELKRQIQREADDQGQSFNTEVVILLRKALEVE